MAIIFDDEFIDNLFEMFNFCPCGQPTIFIYQLGEYLELVEKKAEIPEEYTAYMYLCDRERLTDHGGSVMSAWLTEKGEKLLEDIKKWSEE